VEYYQVDLTDFAAIESTAEEIRKQHGDPTVLINNAGVGELKPRSVQGGYHES
jgi:NAD(P)-dependent dehydrogenase (short-subunit alcohol dehydrogenase family)